MNEDLLRLVKDYATSEHSEISASLVNKSKDNLVGMLLDLMTLYYNDLNSSTLREMVVALLSGFTPSTKKLGYNGYRQEAPTAAPEYCEIKPKNVRTASSAKNKPKLDGGGNFGDYSWRKFERHKNENPTMLVAGFIDGRLVYIFQFNFNSPQLTSKIHAQLQKRFPQGDLPNEYLRSASFTFNHFKDIPELQTRRFASKDKLDEMFSQKHISKPVYEHLQRFAQP